MQLTVMTTETKTYPHVYREYVEDTTPPVIFYSTRSVPDKGYRQVIACIFNGIF